jgi:valyl-tRNA synthetase
MMPFITEEIWQKLPINRSDEADCLIVADWPAPQYFADYRDEAAERRIELVKAVVTAVRATRARYGISPKEPLNVVVSTSNDEDAEALTELLGMITHVAKLPAVGLVAGREQSKPENSSVTVAAGLEIYIPLEGLVDFEAEAARLTKERDKVAGELAKLEKKLSNEGFLAKAAPEIIEKDQARAAELREALVNIEAQLD